MQLLKNRHLFSQKVAANSVLTVKSIPERGIYNVFRDGIQQ
jgi:hypothetical protein